MDDARRAQVLTETRATLAQVKADVAGWQRERDQEVERIAPPRMYAPASVENPMDGQVIYSEPIKRSIEPEPEPDGVMHPAMVDAIVEFVLDKVDEVRAEFKKALLELRAEDAQLRGRVVAMLLAREGAGADVTRRRARSKRARR